MTDPTARQVALRTLGRIRRDSAFAGAVLSRELVGAALEPRETAFVTRLVHGVLATEGVLDEALARYVPRRPEPRVQDVLRLGAYELLFGRAAPYAVVDTAVREVRRIRPAAAGMTNAVLRRLAADASEFPWGDPSCDRDALARATGTPRWIVDVYLDALGDERGRAALFAGLEPAPSYVRLDPFASERDATLGSLSGGLPLESPPDPDCFLLRSPAAVYGRTDVSPGWFAMDAAAQMAPSLCRPGAGMRILDIGAGRGNKTLCMQAIAVRGGAPAEITALDVSGSKSARLAARLETSGVPGVQAISADATSAKELGRLGEYDVVLVDAPCTGLGTLRRYPEKRWRVQAEDLARMAALQDLLLASAAGLVRPGGRLVYSTCSLAPIENGEAVRRLLSSGPGASFRLVPLGDALPADWGMFIDSEGSFQSWPTVGGPDGHYVAVLERSA